MQAMCADLLRQFGLLWDWSRSVLTGPHASLQTTLLFLSFSIHSLLFSAAPETRTLPELDKEAESS